MENTSDNPVIPLAMIVGTKSLRPFIKVEGYLKE